MFVEYIIGYLDQGQINTIGVPLTVIYFIFSVTYSNNLNFTYDIKYLSYFPKAVGTHLRAYKTQRVVSQITHG